MWRIHLSKVVLKCIQGIVLAYFLTNNKRLYIECSKIRRDKFCILRKLLKHVSWYEEQKVMNKHIYEDHHFFEPWAPMFQRWYLSPLTAVVSMLTTQPWPIGQKQIDTSWIISHIGNNNELIPGGKILHWIAYTWHWRINKNVVEDARQHG